MSDEAILISDGSYTISIPSTDLRFLHGRLQQRWSVRIVKRHTEEHHSEWRDVPDATP